MMLSQYQIFIIFILLGIFLSFIFDLFRILRKSFKTPDIITYLEDIAFWLISRYNIVICNI
ncbi:MAG: spore cortex biosynthesis protein YabQ [Clostridia bacterium]|nr:spore cortex biosynthesis protein YabQ [Clostridia bacterium]